MPRAKTQGRPAVQDDDTTLVVGRNRGNSDGPTVLLFRAASYDEDGTETLTDWRIPAKPRPRQAMAFLRTMRREGYTVAFQQICEELLGPDAYDALMAADPDEDEMAAVSSRLHDVLLGKGSKGN